MEFEIYQSRMTRHDQIVLESMGWEAGDVNLAIACRRDVMFSGGSKGWNPHYFKTYRMVASVEARDLDEVFEIGNIGPQRPGASIDRHHRMHSVSVGDIVRDEDGTWHMVDGCGFAVVEVK